MQGLVYPAECSVAPASFSLPRADCSEETAASAALALPPPVFSQLLCQDCTQCHVSTGPWGIVHAPGFRLQILDTIFL